MRNNDWHKAEEFLNNDGVVVLPTDTLYGLVASVYLKKAVDKIYKIKQRDKRKALIVLISSIDDLDIFGVKLGNSQAKFLEKIWPGQVSVILPCRKAIYKYIHRGIGKIAFRMIGPRNKNLYELIRVVGPIVAPSANKENDKPAETIKEAKNYFKGNVDIYINGGRKVSEASTLIRFENEQIEILRQGKVKIKK